MEQLYLVPHHATYEESSLLFEGLFLLQPQLVENLLKSCRIIKVKRLFMVLAEKYSHTWLKKINVDIDLTYLPLEERDQSLNEIKILLQKKGFGQVRGPAPTKLSLPDVVHRFKSLTTHKYTMAVKKSGWFSFPGRLWQRNYYEHIVRDENYLFRIRQYIADNPARWDEDENNPLHILLY